MSVPCRCSQPVEATGAGAPRRQRARITPASHAQRRRNAGGGTRGQGWRSRGRSWPVSELIDLGLTKCPLERLGHLVHVDDGQLGQSETFGLGDLLGMGNEQFAQ